MAAPLRLLVELIAAALRAVAADSEKHVHPPSDQVVHGQPHIHRPARGAQHRAAMLVNVVHEPRRQRNRLRPEPRVEPLVAAAKPEHFLDPVGVVQLQEERTDDIIQPGAQTATRHDARTGLFGIEIQPVPRPGQLEQHLFLGRGAQHTNNLRRNALPGVHRAPDGRSKPRFT